MPYFDDPNVSDFAGVLEYANYATDGLTGMFLIFLVFAGVTIVAAGATRDFSAGVVAGAFAAALSSMFFFLMGIISESIMVICVIAAAGSLVFTLIGR